MTELRRPVSLLWRILFSTSIAITVLFAIAGWILQQQSVRIAFQGLEAESRASFRAYESLWNARADQLATVSRVLSLMPQVRAAFNTRDQATIADAAGEMWDKISHPGTLFLITEPSGAVIANAGSRPDSSLSNLAFVRSAAMEFPKQARGFEVLGSKLYQIVVTPVYVAGGQGSALLNVLVAGIPVDEELGKELKAATGGSEFVFLVRGQVAASTFTTARARVFEAGRVQPDEDGRVRIGGTDYYQVSSVLSDLLKNPVGELRILRSYEAASNRIATLRNRLIILWIAAMLAGIVLTYLLARRLLRPVEALDRAATEIAKGNYDVRVPVEGRDEIGRLAETFNSMCSSVRKGREELIRQERLSTIGRLSTSIIHDLRNPLAAIYGGAEMLVDSELSPEQVRRLSANIYSSSRTIQSLLQELADVTQGRAHGREMCRLRDIVSAAWEPLAEMACSQRVDVKFDVPEDVELPLDRSPMERVFQNLIGNSIEAMPEGGAVSVRAYREDRNVFVSVEDTGPGIPTLIASQLFQPFVTAGKKNGMGLGLALSRKTVLSHGGDLWSEEKQNGACLVMKLPV